MKASQILTLILLLSIWFGAGLVTIRTLPKLFEALYAKDRELWITEGRPIAAFWEPPEGKSFGGSLAATILAHKLLFTTPVWLSEIPSGDHLQRRLRFSLSLQYIAVILVLFTL